MALRLLVFALKKGVQIFLNGQFVPEDRAVVSVFDRGFLYGDGLFETMRVANGQPFRWAQHLARLQQGAEFLKIKLPFAPAELRRFADRLIAQNRLPNSLLRLTVSRGVGARGYSPKNADQPTCVMTLHPLPETPGWSSSFSLSGDTLKRGLQPAEPPRWKLITSTLRLPAGDPLAQFKTANKLWQVLARAEADAAGADEALLLNTAGHVAEATSANVFWVEGHAVCTPPLAAGILPGVTRAAVMELCAAQGLAVTEKNCPPEKLLGADGVFLTLSSLGVVSVAELDGHALKTSPLVETLQEGYARLVANSANISD